MLLIDLWANARPGGECGADQTLDGVTLGEPSARAQEVWRAVRDARDAAIAIVTTDVAAGHDAAWRRRWTTRRAP